MRTGRNASNLLQALTVLCLLWSAFAALIIGAVSIKVNADNGNRDFIEYWAAGRLLVHGGNPYDPAAIDRIERPEGFQPVHAAISLSPPVLFFVITPLGLFSAHTGSIVWSIFLLICLALALRALWVALDRPPAPPLYLLALCFAPILTCMMAGQIGIVLLLAVALFLRLYKTRPFLAGLALTPCSWKPHLFVPFGVAILLWIISRKNYRLMAGFAVGLCAAAAFAVAVDPGAWSQWVHWMRVFDAANIFQPDLSKMFRLLIHPDAVWLQFLPQLACCVWAVWYFWTRRQRWDWMQEGLLLLILSVGSAPYYWYTDESVLISAILAGAYRAHASGRTLLPLALMLAVALTELFKGNWIGTSYYLWTVPAYLLWHLYAARGAVDVQDKSIASEAHV